MNVVIVGDANDGVLRVDGMQSVLFIDLDVGRARRDTGDHVAIGKIVDLRALYEDHRAVGIVRLHAVSVHRKHVVGAARLAAHAHEHGIGFRLLVQRFAEACCQPVVMTAQLAVALAISFLPRFFLTDENGFHHLAQLAAIGHGHGAVIRNQRLFFAGIQIRGVHAEQRVERHVEQTADRGHQRNVRARYAAFPVADGVAGQSAGAAQLLLLHMRPQPVFAQRFAERDIRLSGALDARKRHNAGLVFTVCHGTLTSSKRRASPLCLQHITRIRECKYEHAEYLS